MSSGPSRGLPPPPPADAAIFTLLETAGYLRVHRRAIDELRRHDVTFPKPFLITAGQPRYRRVDLEAWILTRPTGWSVKGGLRLRHGRRPDVEATPEPANDPQANGGER